MSQFIYVNGRVEHSKSLTTQDESAKSGSHGDTVIATAVAYMTVEEASLGRRNVNRRPEAPIGSMAARLAAYDSQRLGTDSDWDDDDFDLHEQLSALRSLR